MELCKDATMLNKGYSLLWYKRVHHFFILHCRKLMHAYNCSKLHNVQCIFCRPPLLAALLLALFAADSLIIIILASVLGGMVVLFLLAAIIVCLWLVMKQKVPMCKSGREDTANARRVLQPPPIQNAYYDSISYNNSRSTSAVYDTVRRGDGPEIFITSSQGTIVDANENSSLRPLQGSSNTNHEPPYDTTIQSTELQTSKEGDPPTETRVPSPYYSYANNESEVELVQQKDGETGWLTVVGRGRKYVKSWTGSDHVYI